MGSRSSQEHYEVLVRNFAVIVAVKHFKKQVYTVGNARNTLTLDFWRKNRKVCAEIASNRHQILKTHASQAGIDLFGAVSDDAEKVKHRSVELVHKFPGERSLMDEFSN